jgi:anti-sigma B factor antagonist
VDQVADYTTDDGMTVVTVTGEIDVYSAPALREKLAELVDAGKCRLIVDLEQVEFLDSTGLGVLIGGLKRVRLDDGSLDLVCTRGRILMIFRLTGLTRVFRIFDSVAEAREQRNR